MPARREEDDLRCLSCGAPFDRPDARKCAFCGSSLARAEPARSTPPAASPARGQTILALGLVILVIGISAAMQAHNRTRHVAPAPLKTTAAAVERPYISDFVTTVPRPKGGLDVLVSLGDQGHPLALFDARTHALRWRSGPFGSLVDGQVILDDERVYVAEQTRVSALRLSDGRIVWESSLATEAMYGGRCGSDCFRVVKDRVLALQRDGTLQGFDAASGRQAWSRKIPGTPSSMSLVGNLVAVNRGLETRDNQITLDLLAAEDGRLVRTLQPWCIDKVFHKRQHPDLGTRELFSADGRYAYFFFGDFSKCAQAMRLDTGEKVWNSYLDGFDNHGSRLAMDDRRIVFAIGKGEVMSIDTATGKVSRLMQDQESESIPLYVLGDQVILRSAPTWDSKRVSLIGVNGSGARAWQFLLSAKDAWLSLEMHPRDDVSTVWIRPTAGGLMVGQLVSAKQISIDILNVKTGVSSGRKLLPTDSLLHAFLHLSDDLLWMLRAGTLQAVSLNGGTVVSAIP